MAAIGRFFVGTQRVEEPAPAVDGVGDRTRLSAEEAVSLLHYAWAAPAIDDHNWGLWLAPAGFDHVAPSVLASALPEGVEARDYCVFCPETGLKVAVFIKEDEVMITFGALNATATVVPPKDRGAYLRGTISAAIYNLISRKPLIFDKALALIRNIKAHDFCSGKRVVLTGQSFGGGTAAYVALKTDTVAYCFNSMPLGNWLVADVGGDKIALADHIIQLTVDRDWLSDLHVPTLLGLFTTLHVPGRRLYVPSAYGRDVFATHTYIVGTIQRYLGWRDDELPSDVMPRLRAAAS